MTHIGQLQKQGFCRFPAHPEIAAWVQHVLPIARKIAKDPALTDAWLRYQGTWFAGVNVLPNEVDGRIDGGPSLRGELSDFIEQQMGETFALDAGQLSVVYPGYPKPMEGETDAAHRFRKNRDAAHVDGLLPVGSERRRHVMEPHSYVLGLPLTQCDPQASPLVVWEGSHHLMRDAFRTALADIAPKKWSEVDLTDIYQATRRRCFEACKRVELHTAPGETYIVHRLALHGVAPWAEGAKAPEDGRMIAYFRPHLENIKDWLA